MPRANRRRDDEVPLDLARVTSGTPRRAEFAGHEWFVRTVRGSGTAGADYRCPGCQLAVTAASPHVVVWPADGTGGLPGLDQRRHWHTRCWADRHTRRAQGSWR